MSRHSKRPLYAVTYRQCKRSWIRIPSLSTKMTNTPGVPFFMLDCGDIWISCGI